MDEPIEREMHRIMCKHYGINGNCMKQSRQLSNVRTSVWEIFKPVYFVDVVCSPDCKCGRMKTYDKKHSK